MPSRSQRGVAASLTALLAAGSVVLLTTAPAAEAATARVSGIDIASWQHPGGKPINWSAVAGAGHRFAVIKATESTTYTNPYFAADRAGARSVGMVVGAYHYARPAKPVTSTAVAQARHFVGVVGREQLAKTLPPVLDLEATGGLTKGQLATWTKTWLGTVRSLTGRTPMLYSYDSFLRNNIAGVADFSGHPLWYARYQAATPTALPGAWEGWRVWQHTSTGSVPGISGDVDLNWFAGSYSDLLKFATGRVPTRVGQHQVQKGERTYLTGYLDRSYAGETVIRAERTTKGVWKWKKSGKVRADGGYTFWVSPRSKRVHEYRIYLRSASPYASVRSANATVAVVKPWVSAHLGRSKVLSGGRVRVSGTVDSFYAGEKVVRYERSGGVWRKKATNRVAADGSYAFWVRPSYLGTHEYRVALRATGPVAGAESRVLELKVRPRR